MLTTLSTSYGELLAPSVNKLLKISQLTPNDVFVDLGSGLGKVVTQVFLNSPVKEAYGIELLPHLHASAQSAATQIALNFPAFFTNNRNLHFTCGDFLQIPFTQATVVLIIATCFDQTLLRSIEKILNQLPQLRLILSLRPMHHLQRLTFQKAVRVECTWDSALCYVYAVPSQSKKTQIMANDELHPTQKS